MTISSNSSSGVLQLVPSISKSAQKIYFRIIVTYLNTTSIFLIDTDSYHVFSVYIDPCFTSYRIDPNISSLFPSGWTIFDSRFFFFWTALFCAFSTSHKNINIIISPHILMLYIHVYDSLYPITYF